MSPLVQTAFWAALISLNTRLVASTFRVYETVDPTIKQSNVLTDTKSIAKREAISTAMIFGFAFLTNLVLKPWGQKMKIPTDAITFASGMIGTLISESLSRYFGYRHRLQKVGPSATPSAAPEFSQEPGQRLSVVSPPPSLSSLLPTATFQGQRPYLSTPSIFARFQTESFPLSAPLGRP